MPERAHRQPLGSVNRQGLVELRAL